MVMMMPKQNNASAASAAAPSSSSNSILRRVSQFEQMNDASQVENASLECDDEDLLNHPSWTVIPDDNQQNETNQINFFTIAFNRFKQDFQSLYPDCQLPFNELSTINQAKLLLQHQKDNIVELTKKLNRSKFTVKFLEEIICRNEKDLDINSDSLKNEISDNLKYDASKEQYVTVITLNDSAYGEIQKISPKPSSLVNDVNEHVDEPNETIDEIEIVKTDAKPETFKEKPEPIYSNTLETQKSSDKASKKRPPTPPRKPKLPNKLNNCNLENTSSKNENNSSRSQFQRKFNGPLQQIETNETSPPNRNQKINMPLTGSKSNKSISNSKNKLQTYMRTFSLEPNIIDGKQDQTDKKSTDESTVSIDDNIYDTVAPDSDCDNDDKPFNNSNNNNIDEENETSSQEMLSRCSSTDELANYVNIDYFLRKDSLGRSNSHLPARVHGRKFYANNNNVEESDENETNMSSIKSEYDHFGSSDNILKSFQVPSNSMRSFNSISTNSSSGSSLRVRNTKMLNKELSDSYPPNLSTFTPPIRDKNHQEFVFKDASLSEKDGSSIYSDEFNLMNNSKTGASSLDKSNSSEADFYVCTDILNNKLDLSEKSICLEEKSLAKLEESLSNDDEEKRNIVNKTESEHSQQMQWNIIRSIIDGETIYLDCLNTLKKYKDAFQTSSKRENALISMEDLNTIFYRIPELFELHKTFLTGLKTVEHGFKLRNSPQTADSKLASKFIHKQSIGELFNKLAEKLCIYSEFLRNYSKAIETANRCGSNNSRFYEIIKSIKVASPNGQFSNLIDLLHEPVARLQKNALVLHDLLKYSENEDEQILLKNALKLNQKFLNELNLDATRRIFMIHDEFKPRRLVKESLIIESENRRKLRHLFLFNDVIVSAKYKASSKQKFTFELRWFQMLNDIVLDSSTNQLSLISSSQSSNSLACAGQSPNINQSSMSNSSDKECKEFMNAANLISSLKSRAFSHRLDLFLEEKRKGRTKASDRLRKKIHESENELLLYLPQLKFSFHVKNNPNKNYIFYLSSEYERNCWINAIKTLQQSASSSDERANVHILQKLIESCRNSISVVSYLMSSFKDDTFRYGDLHMRILQLENFDCKTNLFIVVEGDSFGHYFKRAVARYLCTNSNHKQQDFLIELEGSQNLRFLLYEESRTREENNDDSNEKNLVFKGKSQIELASLCSSAEPKYSEIPISQYTLCFETRYMPWYSIMETIPPNRIYGMFGVSISQVCKKEKSQVPYLILSCINEVERRGLKEVGIYRVSGLSSEVQKLKKAFESNPRDACYLIREIDIHSVTGLLKLYLRELPESLFTNDMYQKYFEARDLKNHEEKELKMTTLLSQLIEPNQSTVIKLIEHLVLVNRFEDDNKMSLNNLATVFGPTMLRTNSTTNSNNNSKNSGSSSGANTQAYNSNVNANIASLMINTDLFTASTIDVMAQADILYFFLRRKSDGLSLTCIDHHEETSL